MNNAAVLSYPVVVKEVKPQLNGCRLGGGKVEGQAVGLLAESVERNLKI